jgi:hypothetical protein
MTVMYVIHVKLMMALQYDCDVCDFCVVEGPFCIFSLTPLTPPPPSYVKRLRRVIQQETGNLAGGWGDSGFEPGPTEGQQSYVLLCFNTSFDILNQKAYIRDE